LIDEIAETPDLVAGDLIVARGDVLHKTQDADTIRAALSTHALWSETALDKEMMLQGSVTKHHRMQAEPIVFRFLLGCFWLLKTNRATLADLEKVSDRLRQKQVWPILVCLAAHVLYPLVLLPYRVRSMRSGSEPYIRTLARVLRDYVRVWRDTRAR
jgi:hypothetical protein